MKERRVNRGSDNIFIDLDIPDPEEHLAKVRIAIRIKDIIKEQNLTQEEAAARMGIKQPAVSSIMKGVVAGFSMERLLRCAAALGQDVEIALRPEARGEGKGHIRVVESLAA